MLEVAPSAYTTPLLRRMKPGRLLSVDLDPAADKRTVDLRASLTGLPLPAESVDLLLCFHVLEHIPRDREAMREVARVLKPNGFGLIQVPWRENQATDEDPSLGPDERTRRYGQADHVRFYGMDFEDRLSASGMEIVLVRAGECLGPWLCEWLGVPRHDPIWVVAPRGGDGLPSSLARAKGAM